MSFQRSGCRSRGVIALFNDMVVFVSVANKVARSGADGDDLVNDAENIFNLRKKTAAGHGNKIPVTDRCHCGQAEINIVQ